jgi:hypothetical protein
MKDIYKQRVDDTIEMLETRVKIVNEMIKGERPADPNRQKFIYEKLLMDWRRLEKS